MESWPGCGQRPQGEGRVTSDVQLGEWGDGADSESAWKYQNIAGIQVLDVVPLNLEDLGMMLVGCHGGQVIVLDGSLN